MTQINHRSLHSTDKLMDIREEVPIKSFSIAAYVCRVENGQGKYLIIKRSSSYLSDTWQMVSGRIEKGEKAVQLN